MKKNLGELRDKYRQLSREYHQLRLIFEFSGESFSAESEILRDKMRFIEEQKVRVAAQYRDCGGEIPSVEISGQLEDFEESSHTDIDESLRNEFDDLLVLPDSEGDMFFCRCHVDWVEPVKKFLSKNFPGLKYKAYPIDDAYLTIPEIDCEFASKAKIKSC